MTNTLLKIQNLTKTYKSGNKNFDALKNISFDINQNEIFSLLGVNGAGKTTLSTILATLHPATSGDINYQDKSIYGNLLNFRKIVGYCPQAPNLDPFLSVRDNLIFAGRYFLLPEDQLQTRADFLIKQYNLSNYINSNINELSGGYKQRVLLARSLMHNPKILILDEPTVGLDPQIRRQLWADIKLLKSQGITVILTTHYLEEAEILSDRVCILDKGQVRLIDTPQNLKNIYNKGTLEDVFIQLTTEQAI